MSGTLPRVPDALDFRGAVQNPLALGEHTGLRNATVDMNIQSLPIAWTGRFAVAFRLRTPDQEVWAARFFTTRDEQSNRGERYQAIASALESLPDTLLPLFVPFDYIEQGIQVAGTWYPMVKMGWAQGTMLGKWVETSIQKPSELLCLASSLVDILDNLRGTGIAHGDWQHDNLLVSEGGREVRFVDYDGMFVPELAGQDAVELGHPNFQHPARKKQHFDARLDEFACRSIVVSLRALALAPELVDRCDNSLLFKRSDYEALEASEMFGRVKALSQRDLALASDLEKLRHLCASDLPVSPVVPQKKMGWWIPSPTKVPPVRVPPRSVVAPAPPLPTTPGVPLDPLVRPPVVVAPRSGILARFNPLRKSSPSASNSRVALDWYFSQMVAIPAGKFLRGSNDRDREKPQKEIYLSDYRIGRTAVTVGMWQEYCNATGKAMPEAPSWGWVSDHPRVRISWIDCKAYADWAGLQLPTEAQWEKAARGIDGREYPWGKDWDVSKCANSTNSGSKTAPVGSYPIGASPYGVLDMSGNVWEWCLDYYAEDFYGSRLAEGDNPVNLSYGKRDARVVRGGSWDYNNADYFRCAYRFGNIPDDRYNDFGFRLSSPSAP